MGTSGMCPEETHKNRTLCIVLYGIYNKDRIHHPLPSRGTCLYSNTGTLKTATKPNIYLDCFPPNYLFLANCRAISNFPFFPKFPEKAVTHQLCDFLHNNGLFENFESGFDVNYSTETAVVKVTNDPLTALDGTLCYCTSLFIPY